MIIQIVSSQRMPSLYCTAEESLSQFKNRVNRLKLNYNEDELYLLSETSVETIIEELDKNKIKFAVIDSIQAVVTDTANGSPGSLTNKELMSYFGYGIGQCFSFGLVGSFILYFYTDILGISLQVLVQQYLHVNLYLQQL